VTSPARKKDIGIEESDILLSFSCFFLGWRFKTVIYLVGCNFGGHPELRESMRIYCQVSPWSLIGKNMWCFESTGSELGWYWISSWLPWKLQRINLKKRKNCSKAEIISSGLNLFLFEP
jgi:hypothetical protein